MKRFSIASKVASIVATNTDEYMQISDDGRQVVTSKFFNNKQNNCSFISSNLSNKQREITPREHHLKRMIVSQEVSRAKRLKCNETHCSMSQANNNKENCLTIENKIDLKLLT